MGERLLVCLLVLAAVLISDWRRLGRNPLRARICYIVLILFALYSAYGFVVNRPLPNLNDLMSFVYRGPAEAVNTALKAPPEDQAAGQKEASPDEE